MSRFEDVFQIPEPCDKLLDDVPWSRSSFCDSCEREIINLSALTRAEAMALIESDDLHCASYWSDASGEVIFADSFVELEQEHVGALRVLRDALWRNAAVLTLPMLLAACEPEPSYQADAVAPLVQLPLDVQVRPGAGRAPSQAPKPAGDELRLGVVKNKVERVDRRYNRDITAVRRVTLKQSLRYLEFIQEERRPHMRRLAGRRARRDKVIEPIIIAEEKK